MGIGVVWLDPVSVLRMVLSSHLLARHLPNGRASEIKTSAPINATRIVPSILITTYRPAPPLH